MSHDAVLIVKSSQGDGCTTVCDQNVTYNYQPALAAMGLRSLSVLDGMSAALAAAILKHLLAELEAHPEYGDLIRGGGTWGTLATLTETLTDMLTASTDWPEGTWQIV